MKSSFFFPIIDNGMRLNCVDYTWSLAVTLLSKAFHGHILEMAQFSCNTPSAALNRVTDAFLQSTCDRMLIIDIDQSWIPEHVNWLISHDVELVSGLYCKKTVEEQWIIDTLDHSVCPFAKDPFAHGVGPLVEVARVPRGFINIHRAAFERIKPHVSIFTDDSDGFTSPEYWRPLTGGHSEDFQFCDTFRKAGGKVYVDQRVIVGHHGMCKFPIPALTPSQK